ncbi:MAG: hypothetical protein ACOVP7_12240 [Lacibacter sp.]
MKYILLITILLLGLIATGQNLVPNPQFETPTPSTKEYSYYNPSMQCYTAPCNENLFRLSPAQHWTMWLGTYQNYACVMAETVKAASNCVPAWPNYVMGNMMHVKTTVGGSGIVNSNVPAGKSKVKVSCWVYVLKGTVYLGYGPTGSPLVSKLSTATCKWEYIEVVYDGTKGTANQVILYASNKGDAEFYVDAVSVIKL